MSRIEYLLRRSRPLAGLVPIHNGRLDLRATKLRGSEENAHLSGTIQPIALDDLDFRNVQWEDLDFSFSQMSTLQLYDSRLRNCVFDYSNLQGAKFWNCKFLDCSFAGADLRRSLLGCWSKTFPYHNHFEKVSFDRADMRHSVHFSERYSDCTFCNSNLDRLSFRGSIFIDCVFSGDLFDVTFFKVPFEGEHLSANRLAGCDFSQCALNFVDFRNIDLVGVSLPTGERHIVLAHGPKDIEDLLSEVAASMSPNYVDYLQLRGSRLGIPGIIAVRDVEDFLSPAQIERLREIASAD